MNIIVLKVFIICECIIIVLYYVFNCVFDGFEILVITYFCFSYFYLFIRRLKYKEEKMGIEFFSFVVFWVFFMLSSFVKYFC